MSHAPRLRMLFPTLDPRIGDLLLLEAHQVAELPTRAPAGALATVLRAHPHVRSYLVARHPPIESWLDELPGGAPRAGPDAVPRSDDLAAAEESLLWAIADEIVYQRAAALYDEVARRDWDPRALTDVAALDGLVVVDAGAGTGLVAFEAAARARAVFAVEPVAALRAFMRERARQLGLANVFVIDGVLDAIPLPEATADVLVTCRAIGWHLEAELAEVARVVRPRGTAVHLTGMPHPAPPDEPFHRTLLAAGYAVDGYGPPGGRQRRYRIRATRPTAHA